VAIYRLSTPISEEDVRKLVASDVVYVSGIVVTARDQAHIRALEFAQAGKGLPIDIGGLVVFHCGPVVRKQDSIWIAVAAGPTTSTRMELYEADFIEHFKPRMIVGKGGMGEKTTEAMKKHGAVYCAYTGGAAVVAAKAIRKVVDVHWLDLGIPEAMWVFEVEDFGPMIVAIDAHGNNMFKDVSETVARNRDRILREVKA
jgi:fumarate hydratase subunit beta